MSTTNKNLWYFIQKSWKTRAIFVFAILWYWFTVLAVFCPKIHNMYLEVSETEMLTGAFPSSGMYLYMIGIVLGIIGYITGLIWVLKKCSKNYGFGMHWIDLIIQRILYGICFVVIAGIASAGVASVGSQIPVAAAIFAFMCALSLVIAFVISGLFIKQSLIAEANIKAKEMYNGKKRSVRYEDNK